jgi:hypothetical protein
MLQGDGTLVYEDNEGRQQHVSTEEVRTCLAEYSNLLTLLANIENGLVTVSMTEYRQFPAPLIHAWQMFRNELDATRHRNKRD